MSLFLIVGIVGAWLLIGVLVCIPLCMSAAHGDRGLARTRANVGRRRRFERKLESAL